eukprot:8480698-Pyramimonas_sp.AAC.1
MPLVRGQIPYSSELLSEQDPPAAGGLAGKPKRPRVCQSTCCSIMGERARSEGPPTPRIKTNIP